MKVLGYILALLCLSSCLAAGPDMVVELFRHGIRSPGSDEYDADKTWKKTGYGELTEAGMRQQYILGAAMKELYPDILNKDYSPYQIYIQATQENRTIMSALSQLYGIYKGRGPNLDKDYPPELGVPPYDSTEVQKVLDTLKGKNYAIPDNYFPLPVHSLLKKGDNLLQSYLNCPNADKYFYQQKNDTKVAQLYKKFDATIQNMEKAGLHVANFDDLAELGDAFIADLSNQVKIPGGIDSKSQDYKDVVFWANWYEIYPSLNLPIQRQLFSGPLLNHITNLFKQRNEAKNELNFVFYAAKESLLASLLSALNIMTPECLLENWENDKAGKPIPNPQCKYPVYASSLIFEFYKNNKAPYIVFKYNGNIIRLCGDKDSCTLTEFSDKIAKTTNGYDLPKFQEWCNAKTGLTGGDDKGVKLSGLDILLLGIVAALLIILVVLYMKTKKAKEISSPAGIYRNLEVVSQV